MAVTALEVVRRQLRGVADKLETLELTMLGIQGTLPEPSAEDEKDIEAMDAVTELRAVIGCVLHDYIGPAKRDLRDTLAEMEGHGDGGSEP
jgi:hypothetical protein